VFRDLARRHLRTATELEASDSNAGASLIQGMAARTAAKADYHAAMKRKYEQAASGGPFWVEPDPPGPPWP
jgi:hypothetical protein